MNKKVFRLIREWAYKRGIYTHSDLKSQTLKLQEEVGELSKAILENNKPDIIDAIGDCVVVLTNIAETLNNQTKETINIESCIELAYEVISKRTGKMENGTFIKDE